MLPSTDPVERVLERLGDTERSGKGWKARCPAHDDGTASLTVHRGHEGRCLLYCFAGCELGDITAAMGMSVSELFPDGEVNRFRRFPPPPRVKAVTRPKSAAKEPLSLAKIYVYEDEDWKWVSRVLRYEPKTFKQQRWDGDTWVFGLEGVRRVIYRLPNVIAAIADSKPIFVVEGEKDVDRMWQEGFAATCNLGGAGNWPDDPSVNSHFFGAHVVLIPDNDKPNQKGQKPGELHIKRVEELLSPYTGGIRVVRLPPEYKDVSEFLDDGGKIVVSTGEERAISEEVVHSVGTGNG